MRGTDAIRCAGTLACWLAACLAGATASAQAAGAGAASPPDAAEPPAADAGPRLRKERRLLPADPDLLRAWRAYGEGEHAAARSAYLAALAHDAGNVQAWNGLALLALQGGNHAAALECYRRAAAADPKNPAALAGLALLEARPAADAALRLKQLLAEQPRAAALHFALGNIYADQAQWGEAERAYFAALDLEGDNPDYLFNLAVSLDHLRQPHAALRHYRAALVAAGGKPTAFAPADAERRIAELSALVDRP
ncbi:MAG: tetratricopeptide repeat protein [Rhodocyclaceae bacterium]|nr:tetratricopeptide repeat protein [Rhodocyclaceae bacterium]MBX3670634.1 tetratricopeptide repeat protein [Rhodocyclaceae bacterium]